jgi:hypothetical protein
MNSSRAERSEKKRRAEKPEKQNVRRNYSHRPLGFEGDANSDGKGSINMLHYRIDREPTVGIMLPALCDTTYHFGLYLSHLFLEKYVGVYVCAGFGCVGVMRGCVCRGAWLVIAGVRTVQPQTTDSLRCSYMYACGIYRDIAHLIHFRCRDSRK